MFLTKEFVFHAAHFLENYHGKCERLHGHTYKLLVTLEGPVQDDGLVMDFVQLKDIIQKSIIDRLDHYNLNDIIGTQTSAENIAIWIWNELEKALKIAVRSERKVRLYEVRVWETPESSALYRGQ